MTSTPSNVAFSPFFPEQVSLEHKMIAAAIERLQLQADVRDLFELGGKFFGNRRAATIDLGLSMQMIKRIVGVQRHDGVNVMRIPRVRIAAGSFLIVWNAAACSVLTGILVSLRSLIN
jgi:hypothetical protein